LIICRRWQGTRRHDGPLIIACSNTQLWTIGLKNEGGTRNLPHHGAKREEHFHPQGGCLRVPATHRPKPPARLFGPKHPQKNGGRALLQWRMADFTVLLYKQTPVGHASVEPLTLLSRARAHIRSDESSVRPVWRERAGTDR